MKQPLIKSNYQKIRLWFEFYKLSLQDKDLKDNLKKSKKYYEPWGDVTNTKFDKWFESHEHLFTIKVQEITEIPRNNTSLNISIPLTQSVTQSLKEIKQLLTRTKVLRKRSLGKKKTPEKTIKYEFTKGVKINGKNLYEILIIYSIWLGSGKPPINTTFLLLITNVLRNRPRSHWVPYVINTQPKKLPNGSFEYTDEQIRSIRRYIKKAKLICQSVSRGSFPGRSTLN